MKKLLKKSKVRVFIGILIFLVFVVVGWYANWWIVKYPIFKVKRVCFFLLSKAFPVVSEYLNIHKFNGSPGLPYDKDVEAKIYSRVDCSSVDISNYYQQKFLDKYSGNEIYKIQYCFYGTIGIGEHKSFDELGKYGESCFTSDLYSLIRVSIISFSSHLRKLNKFIFLCSIT